MEVYLLILTVAVIALIFNHCGNVMVTRKLKAKIVNLEAQLAHANLQVVEIQMDLTERVMEAESHCAATKTMRDQLMEHIMDEMEQYRRNM